MSAGGIEIYGSTFSNIAVGKDYPLITFTSGEVSGNYRSCNIG